MRLRGSDEKTLETLRGPEIKRAPHARRGKVIDQSGVRTQDPLKQQLCDAIMAC